MEHLQTQDKKQRRIVYSKGGNEVLWLAYPTVTGDTPAATHTATLVKALVDFGEKEAAKIAAAALLTALQSGRLFDFTRHTYDVSLKIARLPTHTEITLAVVFHNGNSPVFEKKKIMYWDSEEHIQLPQAPRRSPSRHKHAKKAAEV